MTDSGSVSRTPEINPSHGWSMAQAALILLLAGCSPMGDPGTPLTPSGGGATIPSGGGGTPPSGGGGTPPVTANCTAPTQPNTPEYIYVVNGGIVNINDPSQNIPGNISAFQADYSSRTLQSIGTFPLGLGPWSISISPFSKYAYVSHVTAQYVSMFSIQAADGTLSLIGTPVPAGNGPIMTAVHPSETFAFTINLTTPTLTTFQIKTSPGGNLIKVGDNLPIPDTTPHALKVHPNGDYVYVVGATSDTVSTYSFNQTTQSLTKLQTIDVDDGALDSKGKPINTHPASMAMDPLGEFLWVGNLFDSSVTTYGIDQSTGTLIQLGTAKAGNQTNAVAIHPQRLQHPWVFASNNFSNNVTTFAFDKATGALTKKWDFPAGTNPRSAVISNSGHFLFVTHETSDDLWMYCIDQTTGALAKVDAKPVGINSISVATVGGM